MEADEQSVRGVEGGTGHEGARVFNFVRGIVFVLGGEGITNILRLTLVKKYADEVLRFFRRALDAHPIAARKRAV